MLSTHSARRITFTAAVGAFVLAAAACYPDRPTTYGGAPTVTTIPAPNVSFATRPKASRDRSNLPMHVANGARFSSVASLSSRV